MSRPSHDATFMEMAHVAAKRSLCVKRQVGAVVVDAQHRVLGTGYNGPPAGLELETPCNNWCAQGAQHSNLCCALHAELNALLFTDRRLREGGTIYITAAPCLKCSLAVANSGLSRLVCPSADEQHDQTEAEYSSLLLVKAGVSIHVWA